MQAGIHLVHKPVGPSSGSLVEQFREDLRAAGVRPGKLPVCHGGALDPFAHGLLLLLAGPATRLMELLHPIPKSYEAEIAWGAETDNGDLLGRVVREGDASALTPPVLDEALRDFLGWQDQVPPAHSNKRVGGERAYEKARRGEEFVLPSSRVYLHEARFLSHDLPRRSRLLLTSRGGYYVRALARDLGRALGCGAHLSALHRTAIGPWEDPPPGERVLVQGESLLPWCASRELDTREANAVLAHRQIARGELRAPTWKLPPGFPDPDAPVRGLQDGKLLALMRTEGATLRPGVVMGRPI
jgi:tRNA pseudouridine55 synthase